MDMQKSKDMSFRRVFMKLKPYGNWKQNNHRYYLLVMLAVVCVYVTFRLLVYALYNDVDSWYQSHISEEEKHKLYNMLQHIDRVMGEHNLTFLLLGGTLLGSYRHHGMIPWDDDIDVMFNSSQLVQVKKALDTLHPHFVISKKREYMWKLHPPFGQTSLLDRFRGYNWTWPLLDMFFFTENSTHIWHKDTEEFVNRHHPFYYQKKDVFPLTRRPYGQFMLPCPCNTELFLILKYSSIDHCLSHFSYHKFGFGVPRMLLQNVSCEKLQHFVPLVHRKDYGSYYLETLTLNKTNITTVRLNKTCEP